MEVNRLFKHPVYLGCHYYRDKGWLELAGLSSGNEFQYYNERIFGFRAPLFGRMYVCAYVYMILFPRIKRPGRGADHPVSSKGRAKPVLNLCACVACNGQPSPRFHFSVTN
jgi:hypothetical protein